MIAPTIATTILDRRGLRNSGRRLVRTMDMLQRIIAAAMVRIDLSSLGRWLRSLSGP